MHKINNWLTPRRLGWLALLFLVFYALAFQGMRGLWDSSEGRYVNVALEMLRFNDWLHPITHHEHPHWTKPPVTYWALATAISNIGQTEWATRLPGALAFMLTTGLLFLLGRIFTPQRPWLPPVIYASFLLPATASNVVTTDNLLTLAETAAMTGFAYAIWASPGSLGARHGALLGWIAAGVGFLIKGPAVGLPIFALVVFYLRYRRELGAPRMAWIVGPLIGGVIGVSWFMALSDNKPALLIDFVWNEVILRATTGEHHRNAGWAGGFRVYLPILILGTLPWTWTMLRGVLGPLRDWWRSRRSEVDLPTAQTRLLLLWLLLPLLVFMLARSRLPLYVLPLFVPLALLTARAADGVLRRRYWYVLPVVGVVAVLALRVGGGVVTDQRDARSLAMQIERIAPGPLGEVVFVDQSAQQGLSFYLDAEVETVNMDEAVGPEGQTEDLTTEYAINEPHRLWLLQAGSVEHFTSWAKSRQLPLRHLGQVDGLHPYQVFVIDQAR